MANLSVSFADQSARTTANTTLASVPIGTASPDRVVIINVGCNNNTDPTSPTIGGVAGHFVQDGSSRPGMGWIWANVPTGTTATVVLGGATTGYGTFGVWATTGDPTAAVVEALSAITTSIPFTTSTSAFSVAAGDALISLETADAGTTLAYSAGVTAGTPFTDGSGEVYLNGAKAYASSASQVVSGSVTAGSPSFLFMIAARVHGTAIAGTLAATETTDTAALSGKAGTSGTLATTEGADTASISGAFAIKGTLAATEAADTAALTGSFSIRGTLAATESTDVAAISGKAGTSGTLSVTESPDIASFTSTSVVTGTLAATETTDAASLSGNAGVSGTLSTTGAVDTASISGSFAIVGSLVTTDGTDVASFSGNFNISGTLSATGSPDVAFFTDQTSNNGVLAAFEAPDVASFTAEIIYLPSSKYWLAASKSTEIWPSKGMPSTAWTPKAENEEDWTPKVVNGRGEI